MDEGSLFLSLKDEKDDDDDGGNDNNEWKRLLETKCVGHI